MSFNPSTARVTDGAIVGARKGVVGGEEAEPVTQWANGGEGEHHIDNDTATHGSRGVGASSGGMSWHRQQCTHGRQQCHRSIHQWRACRRQRRHDMRQLRTGGDNDAVAVARTGDSGTVARRCSCQRDGAVVTAMHGEAKGGQRSLVDRGRNRGATIG